MKMTRRRFLAISACFAASPAAAQRNTWQGRAFGADVAITLTGPADRTEAALAQAQRLIRQIEGQFSLYDPASDLVRLNRTGRLKPSGFFAALMRLADQAHSATGGLFDPTVQPMWHAISQRRDPATARGLVGWHRISFDADHVTLAPGQALTFNGIAQGFATDRVADLLQSRGFEQALVNIGEFRGIGGPWRLGIEDPAYGVLATRTLSDGAIATSSPDATPLGAAGHIIHAALAPRWSTVTVEADTAGMADALSTGLVFAGSETLREVRDRHDVRRITLIDKAGDLTTL